MSTENMDLSPSKQGTHATGERLPTAEQCLRPATVEVAEFRDSASRRKAIDVIAVSPKYRADCAFHASQL